MGVGGLWGDPGHRAPAYGGAGAWKGRALVRLVGPGRGGNAAEVSRNLRSRLRFGQIFIFLQPSRHAKLPLHWQNSYDSAPATNPRVLGQRDLGGHNQRQFHRITFSDLKIGVEKYTATAQVLGKTVAFAVGA